MKSINMNIYDEAYVYKVGYRHSYRDIGNPKNQTKYTATLLLAY